MSSKIASISHVQKVRILYKSCLKLHRGLPSHLKTIGDVYVKDEFKRHKKADAAQTNIFLEAWAKYAITLTQQLGVKGHHMSHKIGEDLKTSDLNFLSDEQIVQLHELYKETKQV